ncbi:MAG: thiamine pyrophosphate-binding protein [Gammaproteobacteria bacterium]|nr:thiamine pyrophosphate-binding protein [Gammaproteobacteria bacterium]
MKSAPASPPQAPGATNLITGIANAYADQQPILILTGETSTHIFGKGGLQESSGEGGSIDQGALFQAITRYHKVIERTDYLPQVLNQASQILLSDKPGPVLLSLPFNIQTELLDETLLDTIKTQRPQHSVQHHPDLNRLHRLLSQAKKPVIVAGYGCVKAGAQAQVAELSEHLNIPVTTSLKGKGIVCENSPLSLGSLGVTSSGYAHQYLIQHADLILFLGASFNERTSYLWKADLLANKIIIQVDRNSEQLEKVFQADLAIGSDIKPLLTGLLEKIPPEHHIQQAHKEQLSRTIQALKKSSDPKEAIFQQGFDLIAYFYQKLAQHFPEKCVIFDDNIIYAQNFFHVSSKNHYYPNSGISSLGHAIPAAIGAQFFQPHPTFAILGDGGFQMCCMEIMTAVNYKKPLNIVMFNNATMGLIRKNQHQQYHDRFINCDFINPDYQQLAQSFGIEYKKVSSETDLDCLFSDFDLKNTITLIDIDIDKDAFPNYASRR